MSWYRLEGQERTEEVVWDGCVAHSADVPSPHCAYVPCLLLEDKQGGNSITESRKGEMADLS